MNILMLSSEFPPVVGGIASHVHELSKMLVHKGHNVTVISRQSDHGKDRENLDGIQVVRPRLVGSRWIYAWQLRRVLQRERHQQHFDLIHVHGIRPLLSLAGIDTPICFTNHSSGFLKRLRASTSKQKRTLKQLSLCRVILSPSRELDEATVSMGYQGEHHYIANGVDVEKFSPGASAIRAEQNIPEDAICLVLSRRLVEKNGVLFFARAVAKIPSEKLYVLVAGDGSLRDAFEDILKPSPIWDRVRMLGYVANQDMVNVYRAANLVVLPSLMEATSISGLEAMATGLPLIGTSVGGIPELIEEGQNGFLVPPADVDALQLAISKAIEKPDLLEQMGQISLAKAKLHYSWSQITEQVLDVYQGIVTQP